ncbi:MAG: hypothetical protein VX398_04840, partial [Acidobacteriota bacterium]|nr:hypothetical protein [Acidobacteriota bacterium]
VACVTSVAFAPKLQTACETIAARPLLLVPEPSGITTSGDGTSFAAFIDQNGTSSPVWNPSVAGKTDLGTIMYTS